MKVRDVVAAHLRSAHETAPEAARAAALLDRQKDVEVWPQLIARERCFQSAEGLHQVLDRATAELYRDADAALKITDAVLAHPLSDKVVRGRALRLQANGLHRKSEGNRARAVLQMAMNVLESDPAGILELLHAKLFAAYLRNETGDADVLLEVRSIAKTFARHGDAKGALQARVMEAAILFERDEFLRAIRVNREALSIAENLNDKRQQAIVWNNLGQCAQRLGHIAYEKGVPLRAAAYAEEAMSYFARATPLYEELGMDAESQKIIWAIAGIAQQRGDLAGARAQLIKVREELLQRSMFLAAALVALDLLELVVMFGRPDLVGSWLEEIESTFSRAGMPRYAIDALDRVRTTDESLDPRTLIELRSSMRESFARAA